MLNKENRQGERLELVVIVVTHDSQAVLTTCIAALEAQTAPPDRLIIIDSGSCDTTYLDDIHCQLPYMVHKSCNIGFGAANNLGLRLLNATPERIAFINPDTFLEPDALAVAVAKLAEHPDAGVVTGILSSYDLHAGAPTGLLDSTGVFRTWYGRWYDRGQGTLDDNRFDSDEYVPAACGALMLCRMRALEAHLPQVFDESFFMYKEDIDICMRLSRCGWRILYTPEIRAYHCRGWTAVRRGMKREARLQSARNEVKLTVKHRSFFIVWALMKYLLVRYADI